MIDPQLVADAFRETIRARPLPVPTSTVTARPLPLPTTTSVAPIPTVIPDVPTFEKIGEAGIKILWVVFVIMLLSTVVLAFLTWRTPVQKRVFHLLTTFLVAISAITYYAQATGSGMLFSHRFVHVGHKHGIPHTREHIIREVPWVRHADWLLTMPLILLDLAFLAGLDGANVLVTLFAGWVVVIAGWFFAYAHHEAQRWGWYAIACVAFLVVVYQLAIPGRRAVLGKDRRIANIFAFTAAYEMIVLALYLINTAIADGARKSSVNTEVTTMAIVDVLAKPVFGFWLLLASWKYVPSIEGFWAHGLSSEGMVRLDDDRA